MYIFVRIIHWTEKNTIYLFWLSGAWRLLALPTKNWPSIPYNISYMEDCFVEDFTQRRIGRWQLNSSLSQQVKTSHQFCYVLCKKQLFAKVKVFIRFDESLLPRDLGQLKYIWNLCLFYIWKTYAKHCYLYSDCLFKITGWINHKIVPIYIKAEQALQDLRGLDSKLEDLEPF